MGKPEYRDNGNPSRRLLCSLILDVSDSMNFSAPGVSCSPIGELQAGVLVLKREVESDPVASLSVEICVVSFGGTAKLVHGFSPIEDFQPPVFKAAGCTPMGEAIMMALDRLHEQKQCYREDGIPCCLPLVVLITDGAPTDIWQPAAKRIHEGVKAGKFTFWAVGVEGANMDILAQIAPPNRPPVKLRGLEFRNLFEFISMRLSQMSRSQSKEGEQIQTDPIRNWPGGNPFYSARS